MDSSFYKANKSQRQQKLVVWFVSLNKTDTFVFEKRTYIIKMKSRFIEIVETA